MLRAVLELNRTEVKIKENLKAKKDKYSYTEEALNDRKYLGVRSQD